MNTPRQPGPPTLQLLDSAGVLDALRPLAARCGLLIEPSSGDALHGQPQAAAPAPASGNSFHVRLQSVPATADAHWFQHVAPDHVPVRFHLPHAAELVVLPAQTETQVSHAADLLVQLGLTPTLTTARAGLVIDRVRHGYFNEGLALLGEGVAAADIEAAGTAAGYRAGPLALLDEEGLETTDALYHQTLDGHGCGCGHDHDHHGHEHHEQARHSHDHHAHDHGHEGHDHHHDDGHGCGCGCGPHEHDGHGDGHSHESHDHAHEHGHGHEHQHAHHHDEGHHVHGHEEHARDEHHHHDHDHAQDHGHEHEHPAHADTWPVLTEEAAYAMEKMAHGFQRKGRAAGGGFYDYYDDEDEDPDLWSGLSAFLRHGVKLPADDVRDRLRYSTWVALLDSLHTRALPSATTADVAARGAGLWEDSTSAPLATLRALDADEVERRAAELAERYGPRFALPADWRELVKA